MATPNNPITASAPSAPVTAAPASNIWLTVLNIVKYMLPVGAAIATIFLHNKTTAMQIDQAVGVVESDLPQ